MLPNRLSSTSFQRVFGRATFSYRLCSLYKGCTAYVTVTNLSCYGLSVFTVFAQHLYENYVRCLKIYGYRMTAVNLLQVSSLYRYQVLWYYVYKLGIWFYKEVERIACLGFHLRHISTIFVISGHLHLGYNLLAESSVNLYAVNWYFYGHKWWQRLLRLIKCWPNKAVKSLVWWCDVVARTV